jgi:hypothetical protein
LGTRQFTSENGGLTIRSKKIKKFIDDSMAIFSLAETSADASRYLTYGKGGWPHQPTKPVASNGEKQLAES